MMLTYASSANTIHIVGPVYDGRDTGGSYGGPNVGLRSVDFTYQNVAVMGGDDDLTVLSDGTSNGTGTITQNFGLSLSFTLDAFSGSQGFAFRLGDEDDDLGHRGFPGISGWGMAHA